MKQRKYRPLVSKLFPFTLALPILNCSLYIAMLILDQIDIALVKETIITVFEVYIFFLPPFGSSV
jgi:hypothetical protein